MRPARTQHLLQALLTVLALGMIGCSASGQAFHAGLMQTPAGESKIFVYRPDQFVGGGYTANIMLDGQLMGRLRNGGYISASVAPGRHTIEIDKAFYELGGRDPTTFITAVGQIYFVRYDQSASMMAGVPQTLPAVGIFRDGFNLIPAPAALQELKALKESE